MRNCRFACCLAQLCRLKKGWKLLRYFANCALVFDQKELCMSFLEESFYDRSDVHQHWVFHPFVPHRPSHSFLHTATCLSSSISYVQSPTVFLFLLHSLSFNLPLCVLTHALLSVSFFLPPVLWVTASFLSLQHSHNPIIRATIDCISNWDGSGIYWKDSKQNTCQQPLQTKSVYTGHHFVLVVDRSSALIAL